MRLKDEIDVVRYNISIAMYEGTVHESETSKVGDEVIFIRSRYNTKIRHGIVEKVDTITKGTLGYICLKYDIRSNGKLYKDVRQSEIVNTKLSVFPIKLTITSSPDEKTYLKF